MAIIIYEYAALYLNFLKIFEKISIFNRREILERFNIHYLLFTPFVP